MVHGKRRADKYIREQRKFTDNLNEDQSKKGGYIFVADKDIDKNRKDSILRELDEKYGISQQTIFVDNMYSKIQQDYFIELREYASKKTKEIG